VGPKADLDAVVKRKIPNSRQHRDNNAADSSSCPVLIGSGLLGHIINSEFMDPFMCDLSLFRYWVSSS